MIRKVRIEKNEIGLRFRHGEFLEVLEPGRHWELGFLGEVIHVQSEKALFLIHQDLDALIRSGKLEPYAEAIDLKDDERALLWVDGRFNQILGPGRYLVWKRLRELVVDRFAVTDPRFEHRSLLTISKAGGSDVLINTFEVEDGHACVYFRDGKYVSTLSPGFYAFWRNVSKVKFYNKDLREKVLDVAGQEIITADKVSLRMNAVLTYRIEDVLKSVQVSDDPSQSLYRECQLALRSAVGARELDELLSDKDALVDEIEAGIAVKAKEFGLAIVSFGIRDIILPGDMRDLMNKVVEAHKAAEANLISRREETAATRSQCNTAKMLENNPTLMRLRELEVLERIAGNSKLNLVLGEKGLADRVTNLL